MNFFVLTLSASIRRPGGAWDALGPVHGCIEEPVLRNEETTPDEGAMDHKRDHNLRLPLASGPNSADTLLWTRTGRKPKCNDLDSLESANESRQQGLRKSGACAPAIPALVSLILVFA